MHVWIFVVQPVVAENQVVDLWKTLNMSLIGRTKTKSFIP